MLLVDGSKTQNMAHVNVSDVPSAGALPPQLSPAHPNAVDPAVATYLQQLKDEPWPCEISQLSGGYWVLTFSSPHLATYRGQRVLSDFGIDWNQGAGAHQLGAREQVLYINIEVRNPATNHVVLPCNDSRCVDKRKPPHIGDSHAEFRRKLIHLNTKQRVSGKFVPTVVQNDDTFSLLLRAICTSGHHNVDFFIFLVEVVDRDGILLFKTVFRGNVISQPKSNILARTVKACPVIPLFPATP
jgi:hypothetical protein